MSANGSSGVRNIGVVTTSRADYGIYLPVLRLIQDDPHLNLHLVVSGMHLLPDFGMTVNGIEADGFDISDRVEISLSSDSPRGVAAAMGNGLIGFADSFARVRPDILLVLGDRYEMYSAVAAALPFNIPVAHIHGGESSEGAIDESIRNAITKMSHLHFVSTDVYGQRVIQMGEEPWRVLVSGAPSLDNITTMTLLSKAELERAFDLDLSKPTLMVTYHPVTLEYEETGNQIHEILSALDIVDFNIVITYPNADTHGRVIIEMIDQFAERQEKARIVDNLGTQAYFSLMSHAAAMVGNSSSGIIEAASFKLPVVNIGNRQLGRIRSGNVVDVTCEKGPVLDGIIRATSTTFRQGLEDLSNRYGDGGAAERIVAKLKTVPLGPKMLMKRFHSMTAQVDPVTAGGPNGY